MKQKSQTYLRPQTRPIRLAASNHLLDASATNITHSEGARAAITVDGYTDGGTTALTFGN